MMIYVDMDGVITDFKGWVENYLPDMKESDWHTSAPYKVMDEHIHECYANQDTLHLIRHMNFLYNNLYNVKFLTAIPWSWYDDEEKRYIATNNKISWLAKHIDNFNAEDVIISRGAKGKINYCNPGDVLYDDRKDTIKAWGEAGGIGIHVEGRKTNEA